MKNRTTMIVSAAATLASLFATAGHAAFSIALTSAPAPTYSHTVVFNSPVGNNLPTNTWAAQGLSSVVGYDTGTCSVLNYSNANPWAPDTNVLYTPWGIEITFAQPVTSVSFQGWGNGGTPSPFGGGTVVSLQNGNTQLDGNVFTAAWGGVGNTWYNITTTGGSTFNRLVYFSNSNAFPEQFISQVSWNNAAVPGPASMALLGAAGLVGGRRRRR